MVRVRRSLLGIWVLGVVVLVKILFLFLAYLSLRSLQHSYRPRVKVSYISTADLIFLLILLAEMVVYWTLRYKIRDKRWVRWHVWSLFAFMVVYPLIFVAVLAFVITQLASRDYGQFLVQSSKLRQYLFWLIVPGSHIFFIITIVESFKPVKVPDNDEPPGLLDEFIS